MLHLPTPLPPVKVGIIRSSSIGDVVLATACLDLLKQLNLPFHVTWLGKAPSLQLMATAYPQVLFVDIGSGAQVSEIVGQLSELHVLVDLQANLRSKMLCRAYKKAYKKPFFVCEKSRFFRAQLVWKARLRGRRSSDMQHESVGGSNRRQYQVMVKTLERALCHHLSSEHLHHLKTLRPHPRLPLEVPNLTESTAIKGSHPRSWQRELRLGRWLAVACGASFQPKMAPVEKLSSIIQGAYDGIARKQKRTGPIFGLLLLGDHNDQVHSRALLDHLEWNGPLLNLTGQISLWDCALALKEAQVILTNDSALGHIAEAVGTPAAVLYGPTSEAFGFAPWSSASAAFSANLGCRPCSKHGKTQCRYGDQRCFNEISTDRVVAHLEALLADPEKI